MSYPKNHVNIRLRLANAGAYAAMLLAAETGDMEFYRRALVQAYKSRDIATRIYEETVDMIHEKAYAEVNRRVVLADSENDKTLDFWTDVVESYENRHILIGDEMDETERWLTRMNYD